MVVAPATNTTTLLLLSLLLLLLLPSTPLSQPIIPNKDTFDFDFDFFNKTNQDSFNYLKDARHSQDAIQLTPDTRNNIPFLQNKSGRAIHLRPFKLWDHNSNSTSSDTTIASFNTTFLINIFRDDGVKVVGEGLAFVIVPDPNQPAPPGSEGGFLGLTNSTTDGDPKNQLVAIEFDTFKQSYDPNDNHVGLNINSVKSNVTAELTVELAPVKAKKYRVWVDYNGTKRHVTVYIAEEKQAKPGKPAMSAALDLSNHVAQKSYFGFAGSTGDNYELNCVLAWSMTIDLLPEDPGKDVKGWVLKAGVPVIVVVAIAVAVLVVWWVMSRRRERRRRDGGLGNKLKSLPGMAREFDYRELRAATGNFGDGNRLGEGGFGVVFMGKLPEDETEIAVKMFKDDSQGEDFLAELTIINRLRHKNLVRLLGWCYKNGKLLLVYDYMPNGSLDRHLFNTSAGTTPLPWFRRYNIVAGVASALHYLHNEYDEKVIHRDLKASNIMLDSTFNARLGDFGLARAIEKERTSYTEKGEGMPGTWGYIAPECLHTGRATFESDVFGFGAVVLEVVCGRRPGVGVNGFRLLRDWVWSLYRDGKILQAVDNNLGVSYVEDEAERLLLLGLACSHPTAAERPKMNQIVQILNKSVAPPAVPLMQPPFVWQEFVSLDISTGDETSSTVGNCYSRGTFSSVATSTFNSVGSVGGKVAHIHTV